MSLWLGVAVKASPSVLAFNCPGGGSTTKQNDAYDTPASGYNLHGWWGNCDTGLLNTLQWYAGEDSRWSWGGSWHNVSYMSIHMVIYVNGSQQYNQTASNYNSAYINIVSPQYTYGFGGNANGSTANGYEQLNGQWSWSWVSQLPLCC